MNSIPEMLKSAGSNAPGGDSRATYIVGLLLTGLGALVVLGPWSGSPDGSATLPAAGLVCGGLYLAWEELAEFRGRR